MRVLIIKTEAAGDVLRTSVLLHKFSANHEIHWYVSQSNTCLLNHGYVNKIITSSDRLSNFYDYVISLEDDENLVKSIFSNINYEKLFGIYYDHGTLSYTKNSSEWNDMGLISKYGLKKANQLKYENKKAYQEILFNGLGYKFVGEKYILPFKNYDSSLKGDIAVAPKAGSRWPNKNWYYYDELVNLLSKKYIVNILPKRSSILEHIADIKNHKMVISNDSFPMHIAIGLNIPTVAFFTCTSPHEIYNYGKLLKLVSPKLEEFFFQKKYSIEAVKSIRLDEAYSRIEKFIAANNLF